MKSISMTKPSGMWAITANHIVNAIRYYQEKAAAAKDPKVKESYLMMIKSAEREYEEIMTLVRNY